MLRPETGMGSALNHSTVHGINRSRGCMYSTGACCATTSANLSFAAMPRLLLRSRASTQPGTQQRLRSWPVQSRAHKDQPSPECCQDEVPWS